MSTNSISIAVVDGEPRVDTRLDFVRFLSLVESRVIKAIAHPKRELRNLQRLERIAVNFGCSETVHWARIGVLRFFIDQKMPIVGEEYRHVYIVEDAKKHLVKVGIASRLSSRVSGIKNGNPSAKCIYSTIRILNARSVEKMVHKMLRPYWRSGEWFNCSSEHAIAAINEAIDSTDTILSGAQLLAAPRQPEFKLLEVAQ